jgi:excisionase family DNA binding protein
MLDTTIPSLLTLEQTSKVLNLPVPTVRKLVREGKLNTAPNVKRHYRISVVSIERYLKEAETHRHFDYAAMKKQGL